MHRWKLTDGHLTLESSQHATIDTLLDIDVHRHGLRGSYGHPESILEFILLKTSAVDLNSRSKGIAERRDQGLCLDGLTADSHVLSVQLLALHHADCAVRAIFVSDMICNVALQVDSPVDAPHCFLNHPCLPIRGKHGNICVVHIDAGLCQHIGVHGEFNLSTHEVLRTVGVDGHGLLHESYEW